MVWIFIQPVDDVESIAVSKLLVQTGKSKFDFKKAVLVSVQQLLDLDVVLRNKRSITLLLVRQVVVDEKLAKIGDIYEEYVFTGYAIARQSAKYQSMMVHYQ